MMISVAAMPCINPLTPRIHFDLLAFLGLGLFGCATHGHLPREHQQFGFNGMCLLCGFGWWLAALQCGLQLRWFVAAGAPVSTHQAGLLGVELPARHQVLHGHGIVAGAQAVL